MTGAMEMVAAAKAGIENLTPAEVAEELDSGDVLLVDLREPEETDRGVIPGAVRSPRGMLEFNADPATPFYLDGFDRGRRVILYCAAGSRSALGACTLQQLGYRDVGHLEGGFAAWVNEGRPVAPPSGAAPAAAEDTMQRLAREELAVAIEGDGVELRLHDAGGMTVCFVRLPAGANLAPALRGLPGDLCPCPHWGYMLKGRVRMHTADGPRDYSAGDAFYWGPGHAPEALEDSEYVDVSPTVEFHRVIDHIKGGGAN